MSMPEPPAAESAAAPPAPARPNPAPRAAGYALLDGERQHRRHPRTFAIPSEQVRYHLAPGAVVKLEFRAAERARNESGVERMWVEVTEVVGPGRYRGELRNAPAVWPMGGLAWGDPVAFAARHVVSVQSGGMAAAIEPDGAPNTRAVAGRVSRAVHRLPAGRAAVAAARGPSAGWWLGVALALGAAAVASVAAPPPPPPPPPTPPDET